MTAFFCVWSILLYSTLSGTAGYRIARGVVQSFFGKCKNWIFEVTRLVCRSEDDPELKQKNFPDHQVSLRNNRIRFRGKKQLACNVDCTTGAFASVWISPSKCCDIWMIGNSIGRLSFFWRRQNTIIQY